MIKKISLSCELTDLESRYILINEKDLNQNWFFVVFFCVVQKIREICMKKSAKHTVTNVAMQGEPGAGAHGRGEGAQRGHVRHRQRQTRQAR